MLADEVNPDVTNVPQVWTLYKEVQNYYEAGLRVPDDVTLLWAEDNWGNVRRLPTAQERRRPGGAGVYYHFDYHGGPRSYQWINTSPLAEDLGPDESGQAVRRRSHLDRQRRALQGIRVPDGVLPRPRLEHRSLDAHEPSTTTPGSGPSASSASAYADDAADILDAYRSSTRGESPSCSTPNTYSLTQHGEADRVVAEFNALAASADAIYRRLPAHKRDAFYQLVLHPTLAAAQVNEMYLGGREERALRLTRAREHERDGGARAALFKADQDLMAHFNKVFAGGKWDHFMDQPHIGYTSWRDPPVDSLDAIPLVERTVPDAASLGVASMVPSTPGPGRRPIRGFLL